MRQQFDIDKTQCGFMTGRGITDAIFILRQLQEKYLTENKDLYFPFINLEKDFVWLPLRKLVVEEYLFKFVQSVYRKC